MPTQGFGGTAHRRSSYLRAGRARRATKVATRRTPLALAPKRRKPHYRANLKLSKPMKSVLNSFLQSKEQTHWNSVDIDRNYIFPYPLKNGGNPPTGIYRCLPSIQQAGIVSLAYPQGQPNNIGSREGVQVRLKSMTVNLQIRLEPTYTGLNDNVDPSDCVGISYKIYVLSCKAEAAYEDVIKDFFGANGLNDSGLQIELFKKGPDPTQWDALTENLYLPLNTNLMTCHATASGTLSKGQASHPQGGGTSVHYPAACRYHRLKLKVKSKILKYAKPEDLWPANFDPFVIVLWKSANGFDFTSNFPETPDFVQVCGSVATSWDDMD